MSQTLGSYIAILSRRASRFYGRALKEHGISAAEYPVFFLLTKQEGLCLEAISKALCLDKGAVTRIIQNLKQKGFIQIEVCQQDHRKKRVHLSKIGQELKPTIISLKKQWEVHLCQQMSQQEIEQFHALLKQAHSSTKEVFQ